MRRSSVRVRRFVVVAFAILVGHVVSVPSVASSRAGDTGDTGDRSETSESSDPEETSASDRTRHRSSPLSGTFFDLSMTGSELDGPTPRGSYDADLFRGLGLAFEAGRRFGAWRVGGALHTHYADNSLLGYVTGDNSVSFLALTANGYRDFPISRRFGVFVGVGLGLADVDAEFSGYEPDPAYGDYYDAKASRKVAAGQFMVGGWFDPAGHGRARLHVGFRYFATAGLDLRDSLGRSFADDAVEMPMAVLGCTWGPARR